jgi:hypothetical protein
VKPSVALPGIVQLSAQCVHELFEGVDVGVGLLELPKKATRRSSVVGL